MPSASPSPAGPAGLSRRTAVGGAVALTALAASGCTSRGDDGPLPRVLPDRDADADADVALAAEVLAAEQDVLDRVLATIERHPRLRTVLAGARSAHEAHVDLLTDAVPGSPSPSPSSPAASPSPVLPSPTGGVPARPGVALSRLAEREGRLSLVGRRSAFAARSGAFARVLASMAAAAAQQSTALSAAARTRG